MLRSKPIYTGARTCSKLQTTNMKHAVYRSVQSLTTAITQPNYHHPHYFLRLLSSCKDLNSLLQIHGRIVVSGLKQDNTTTTHLINSYSLFTKCDSARFVFDSIADPSIILWNSMIRAYTRSNQYKEALKMYSCMLEKRLEPDKYTFTFVLKACTGSNDLELGSFVHNEIAHKGLESDVFIGTGLVDFYCKTSNLKCALQVFDKMPDKDIAAWNAMIGGFSQSKEPNEALECFRRMEMGDVEPNSVTMLNLFPAVSKLLDIELCRSIHGYVFRRSFRSVVSNGMIDMYSKCGHVNYARQIFDRMWGRDDVSWGTMMAGYAHNGCFLEVLKLFDQISEAKLKMNKVSAVSAFMAAAEMRDLVKGNEIHVCAIKQGIDSDILVATPLITMYVKCGELEKAKELFKGLKRKDVVAWSAVMAAFAQSGYAEEALSLFREMQNEDLKPNRVTLMSVLPACAELSSLELGKSVHCYAVKTNIDSDILTGTALVSMYAKCGCFSPALTIFNSMPFNDIVTWNSLINGYAQIGEPYHAMEMFHKLKLSGVHPDSATMMGVLPSCALLDDIGQGTCIHGQIIKSGFELDSHVKNALIDMYAKCGILSSAEFLFNQTEFAKDEVSWNVLIAGYMQNGHAKEAISAFQQMKLEGFRPNIVTIVTVLPAAAYLAALREGMTFHAYVVRMGFQSNTLIGNSLIDMYAKCGRLEYSEFLFNEMENKDTVSWNAMLAGYAVHGHGDRAINLFTLMQGSQVQVDPLSFVSILSACRHAGLVEQGRQIFHSMRGKNCLEPALEHYACMVDLLGRAGLFDEIMDLIKTMPMEPDAAVWGALLGACKMHSNISLGELALDHLIKLEPGNPTHYVVLSGIYAHSGRWNDARNTRFMMKETGLQKTPGCSWVEVKNRLHAFRVGDHSHPEFDSMCLLWNDLLEKMEKMGYVSDRSCVLQNVEEEDKEQFLQSHSERLAITFALLNTEPGATVQIVKNLRVCPDCHTATKFISKITSRKIIVRDSTRFHHFEDGVCSCKDYW